MWEKGYGFVRHKSRVKLEQDNWFVNIGALYYPQIRMHGTREKSKWSTKKSKERVLIAVMNLWYLLANRDSLKLAVWPFRKDADPVEKRKSRKDKDWKQKWQCVSLKKNWDLLHIQLSGYLKLKSIFQIQRFMWSAMDLIWRMVCHHLTPNFEIG